MANLTTTNDILLDALFKAGVINNTSTVDTSDPHYIQGLEYINRIHLDLKKGNGPLDPKANVTFRWAVKHPTSILILEPKYDTGTISVTNGSDTVTASAVIAASRANWHLIVDGEDDVFRISAHSAGSDTLTLDANYTGDTNATATYKLVKLEYTIGSNDIMRLVEPMRCYEAGTEGDTYLITSMDPTQFAKHFPLSTLRSGIPTKFKVSKETDGTWTIQFNKYRDTDQARLEYDFIDIPDDLTVNDTPEVPREFRFIMSDWTASLVASDRNDSKASALFQLAQVGFVSMREEYESRSYNSSSRFGKISPRPDHIGGIGRRLRDLRNITYST